MIQAGTPEEIYTEPATPYVARFTGLAGELPVRVRERSPDGTVLVQPMLARAGQRADSFLARSPRPHPAGCHVFPAEHRNHGPNGPWYLRPG